MPRRRLLAVDCETDPFLHGRLPKPFIWGCYDGNTFRHWRHTDEFVTWLSKQDAIAYAHNGGKFDYLYLIKYLAHTRVKIIAGRFAELTIGKCKLRDSYSIIPVPQKSFYKDEADYNHFEENVREHYMQSEIIPYLKSDCVGIYKAVSAYRDAAGKSITIASNALASSRKLGVDPGRTNYRFDTEFRNYYFGGRTECFQFGTHKGVSVIDIVSSYPNAMSRDHPSGDDRSYHDNFNHCKDESEISRCFVELDCYSCGAFPHRTERDGLEFPHRFDRYHVTGWEYLVAKKHGLIKDEKIIRVTTFKDTINFSPYIEKWFAFKQAHPKSVDPINYTIGKIMQNSLYGKLAQNPAKYFDYKMCEPGTEVDRDDGWQLYTIFENVEIHRREAMWNFVYKYGVDWVKRPLYFNVATGASVTGFARAHLLDAIHTVGADNVIYCDTDSLALHPCDTSGLSMGGDLGQWEYEGKNGVGHFAGKKLYAIKFPDKDEPKIASKGSKLDYDHMRRLVAGETIIWENPAPTFSLANGVGFVRRSIRSTANIGDRKHGESSRQYRVEWEPITE